jgi:hypothetical protein
VTPPLQLSGWMLSLLASAIGALIRLGVRLYGHCVIAARGRSKASNGGYQGPFARLYSCIFGKYAEWGPRVTREGDQAFCHEG